MKVNLAWLAEFVDLKVSHEELLERINTQLGEIEAVVDLAEKYAGILIVKVSEVKPHPDADKLSVCLIDDAGKSAVTVRNAAGLIQVVCGAPNVRAGMLAAWIPPGSSVPAGGGKIEARAVRGLQSQGMLASPRELDIETDGEIILEVDSGSAGISFAEAFDLETSVIEIENKMFTHRPDCFGLLGIAREIAAITGSPFKSPQWYGQSAESLPSAGELFSLEVQCPDLVPCLRATIISGLRNVGSSDLRLRARLASVGFKPVNNIVDATNYMMYVSGQPTHAFDFDKLLALGSSEGRLKLSARLSVAGESLELLNGKTTVFKSPAIVITAADQPVALGGIMGGKSAEVDLNTRNVLLECANFDMYSLRRASMHYGVFSEAATRFTKGQSPAQIPCAAAQTAAMITAAAGGEIGQTLENVATGGATATPAVKVTATAINKLLGSDSPADKMDSLLRAVGFKVATTGDELLIEPPFWRTDIEIAEDIVEEIGRLNGGYATLAPVLPHRPVKPAAEDALLNLRRKLRHCLAARGASEVLGYSFVSKAFLKAAGQDPDNSYRLLNPLSPELSLYRQCLTPSLAALLNSNRRLSYKDFALFEIGCAHEKNSKTVDEDGLPADLSRAAFVCHRLDASNGSPFYSARRYLDFIAQDLGLTFDYEACRPDVAPPALYQPYDLANSAQVSVGALELGIIGLLGDAADCAGWEINLDVLLRAAAGYGDAYRPLAIYPKSSQDLTLEVATTTAYGQLLKALEAALAQPQFAKLVTELDFLSVFQPTASAKTKNLSFRLTVWRKDRTLQRAEVSEVIAALIKAARVKHGARQVV